LALLLAACGGGDDDAATATPSAAQATTTATPRETSPAHNVDMCALLSADDIAFVTGYARGLTVPHNGPGTLHFCTVYLDIPNCQGRCALSIDDLGAISANNNNTPELFKESFTAANPDAFSEFTDGVLGENSWLAVVSTADLPEWKLVYFQVNGTAYDLGSPRVPDYAPTDEAMIALGRAVIDKLR
jgi:hypothetical protein